jgi:hypothetical protein
MKIIQIMDKIDDGKNVIFYQKSVYDCFNELQEDFLCVYFSEPIPVKVRLIKIIQELNGDDIRSLNRKTISELKEILLKQLKYERLIICFNHFERLTKRTVQIYQSLNSLTNVQFVCNFQNNFKSELYPFYKTFILANPDKYDLKNSKNEINITYAVYILISIYVFFIYLKTTSSIYMAFILIGAAWFALIIFRTLVFVGGRL